MNADLRAACAKARRERHRRDHAAVERDTPGRPKVANVGKARIDHVPRQVGSLQAVEEGRSLIVLTTLWSATSPRP
jgi:hypothetical protein